MKTVDIIAIAIGIGSRVSDVAMQRKMAHRDPIPIAIAIPTVYTIWPSE